MPSDILNGVVAAQAGNGVTATELAASGQRVFSRCALTAGSDGVLWLVAAEKAIPYIESAVRSESDLSMSAFAQIVCALCGGDLDSLDAASQLAFEASARCWASMVSQQVRSAAQKHEDAAVNWFNKKTKLKPPPEAIKAVEQTMAAPAKNPNLDCDVSAIDRGLQDWVAGKVAEQQAQPMKPQPERPNPTKQRGLSNGFRQAVLLKAEELESRAAGLRKLAEVVGAQYDDALWDLFGEMLTGEK